MNCSDMCLYRQNKSVLRLAVIPSLELFRYLAVCCSPVSFNFGPLIMFTPTFTFQVLDMRFELVKVLSLLLQFLLQLSQTMAKESQSQVGQRFWRIAWSLWVEMQASKEHTFPFLSRGCTWSRWLPRGWSRHHYRLHVSNDFIEKMSLPWTDNGFIPSCGSARSDTTGVAFSSTDGGYGKGSLNRRSGSCELDDLCTQHVDGFLVCSRFGEMEDEGQCKLWSLMQFEVRPQEARLYVIATASLIQAMTRGGTYPANRQGTNQCTPFT